MLFCDEINLPNPDKYGTQKVISFLRQLIERNGFWNSNRTWVHLERVQIIAACNPPTDPGRHLLSPRFTRHCPVLFVDYPGEDSLNTIYSTFSRAALKCAPNLVGFSQALNSSMVDFFLLCKKRFTHDIQAHYIFSPRELTRWIRGIYEIISPLECISIFDLVRCWAHEALRLFQDRLICDDEREWTSNTLIEVASRYFSNCNLSTCLAEPILFSNFLGLNYISVDKIELFNFVRARLDVYYDEEICSKIIL